MRCPECYSVFLDETPTRNNPQVKIDVCPRCKGMWFDAGELHDVLPAAEVKLHAPRDAVESKRSCPKCRKTMREFNYPETFVKVDVCEHCGGIWLDKDEYKELATVRKFQARQQSQIDTALNRAKNADEPGGIKGVLIRFIDSAIDSMIHS